MSLFGRESEGRTPDDHHSKGGRLSHGHSHGGHSHAPADFGKAFAIGVALNTVFVIAEVVFGLRAHSVALVADAGHNLSDVLSLLLAWGAATLSKRPPTLKRSYGLKSTSILASLFNALLLLVAMGAVAWEAIGRFAHPEPVVGNTVVWVALVGIVINGATALLFMSGRHHDINIRGAFLHMAADAGVSAGVVIAGLIISATGFLWLDPAVSLAIVFVVLWGTWGLLKDSLHLALQGTPRGIDPAEVKEYLQSLSGVEGVHDLHIWSMSTTEVALTAHLVVPDESDTDTLLATLSQELHDRFGVEHPTIQIERSMEHSCDLAPDEVV
ncbi:MAG: cation transporter [Armatimonadetes bacterium]|nr:cation transporter [Armatimonadota bacterium]